MRGLWQSILRIVGYPVDDENDGRSPSTPIGPPPDPPSLHHDGCGCGDAAYRKAAQDASDRAGIESDAPESEAAPIAADDGTTAVQRAYVRFQAAERFRNEAGRKLNAEIARAGSRTGLRPVVIDDSGASVRAPAVRAEPGALVGGRLTVNTASSIYKGTQAIMPPPDYNGAWRLEELDSRTLDKRSPADILEMLANLSPEVSRALWDFLRLSNAGFEYKTFKLGTETEDKRARKLLAEFLETLKRQYGSLDVPINRLFIGAFMRGALFGELVIGLDGKTPVDLATPDPATVRFRLKEDPERGQIWELGQWQAREFVILDRPTISYIPIDPFPGNPYGRPLVAPALFSTLFLIGLLHDLRRVISQQGYPRIDVVVMIDKIINRMPPEDRNDPDEVEKWIEATVEDIRKVYKALEPDDALVHDDGVEVKGPIGTVDSSSLGSVDGVIAMLERMAIRALKTMPLMLGVTDGVSEANANRQWEIFAQGIKSVQHLCETLLERMFELALQAQGVVVDVQFRFSEVRSAEELRDQQTLAAKIENYARMRNEGWIDQDEASNTVTGHDPAEEGPINVAPAAEEQTDQPTDENPEPGSARKVTIRTLSDDVEAFRARMATEGYMRTTVMLRAPRRPATEPGESVMETGAVRHVDGVAYREWDIYSRVDKALPAGQPEGDVPTSVSVDATDADNAATLFARNMPQYAGILDASIETNGTNGTS